jgi:methylated-DNA-[protein]-cysteine S-methyltransferase
MRPATGAVRFSFTTLESPVGPLLLVSDGQALTGLYPGAHRALPTTAGQVRDDGFFSGVRDQLDAYFKGKQAEFSVPLSPRGTEFQRAVWREVQNIPLGVTRTAQDIASALGRPAAWRAIGAAVAKNPISVIIPCHRVGGASAPGPAGAMKRWLLAHEAELVPWRVQLPLTAPAVSLGGEP